MEVLFEDDYLLLRGVEGRTEEVFVSFTGVGGGLGGVQTEEFVGTASQGRNTALFLTDKTRSWSNHLDYALIARLLGPHLNGKKTYYLGNSMGGFNAVVCSRFLPPDVCIAFAPQFSISDAVVPQENRWRQYRSAISRIEHETLDPYFNDTTAYYAFFGSDDAERRHYNLFPQRTNLKMYRVEGAEHTLAALLKKNGILGDLIAECKRKGDPMNVLSPAVNAVPIIN